MNSTRQIPAPLRALWVLTVMLCLFVSVKSAWSTTADERNVSITGVIKDTNGKLVPYAWVKAKILPQQKTVSRIADRKGKYVLKNLEPGSYIISAERLGYRSKAINMPTHQGQKIILDFSLEKEFDPDQLNSAQWAAWFDKQDADLLQSTCSGCHNLRKIAMRRGIPKEEWKALIYRMSDTYMIPDLDQRLLDRISTILAKYWGPNSTMPKISDIPFQPPHAEALKATYIEYDIPLPFIRPHSATVDKKDRVWISGYDWVSNAVAMFDIATESFQFWEMPTPKSSPHTFAFDDKGRVWIPESTSNKLGVILPETGKLTEYAVPAPATGFAYPHSAAIDQEGKVWITCSFGRQIAEFNPETKEFKVHLLPLDHKSTGIGYIVNFIMGFSSRGKVPPIADAKGPLPYGIDVDSRGNVWFTEYNAGQIVKFDPASGDFKIYKPELKGSTPRGMIIDSSDMIWFANFAKQRIGVLNPSTGKIRQYKTPTLRGTPYGLGISPDGKIWYSDFDASLIASFDPKTEKFVEFPLPALESTPRFFGFDSQSRLWYSEFQNGRIGAIVFDSK